MLDKIQKKVGELDSQRDWQYIPIYQFTFNKFHFSQPAQIEQINVLNSPQLDRIEAASPIDHDMFQINNDEPEFDSEDQSDSGSLTLDDSRGDSANVIDDFCTAYHCAKSDNYAQCTDEVHNVKVLMPIRANNTPVLEAVDNKRPRSPVVWVGNVPSQNIIDSRPELDPGTSHAQSPDILPKETCQRDIYTGEYWVNYDPRVHKREPKRGNHAPSHSKRVSSRY